MRGDYCQSTTVAAMTKKQNKTKQKCKIVHVLVSEPLGIHQEVIQVRTCTELQKGNLNLDVPGGRRANNSQGPRAAG